MFDVLQGKDLISLLEKSIIVVIFNHFFNHRWWTEIGKLFESVGVKESGLHNLCVKNFSVFIFDVMTSTKSRVLNFDRNHVGVPNLKCKLLLTIMILIKFLHSNLHSSFAIIVRSNHHGILQWSRIKEIEARFLIIHQLVQIFGLVIQLLGLIIFE